MSHVHESPNVMTLPLIPLALGAIFAGWAGYELFVGHDMAAFWGDSIFILPSHTAMEAAHHVPLWVLSRRVSGLLRRIALGAR